MKAGQNFYYEKPWIKNCRDEIVWRKEKIGFEPPQKNWMQDSHCPGIHTGSKKKTGECRNSHTKKSSIKKLNPYLHMPIKTTTGVIYVLHR